MPPTERAWIADFKAASARGARRARIGIGDDCAVFSTPAGHETLITTDFSIEDVHFRRRWHPAQSVGHRCLARGLSDIAAMGGTPLLAFLSLAVPKGSGRWVRGFMHGLQSLAERYGVELAGGDTTESPHRICADIVVAGTCQKGRALLRSGARPGDFIYVTGELGGSAAALALLTAGKKPSPRKQQAHFYPVPRIEAGLFLRTRKLATAAIDVSDGISTDLSHICEESAVGARVYAEKLPIAPDARKSADSLALALHGGEDYELLFTARPKTRVPAVVAGVPVTRIGEVVASSSPRMTIVGQGGEQRLEPLGWEHFR